MAAPPVARRALALTAIPSCASILSLLSLSDLEQHVPVLVGLCWMADAVVGLDRPRGRRRCFASTQFTFASRTAYFDLKPVHHYRRQLGGP